MPFSLILLKLGRGVLTLLLAVSFVFLALRLSGDPAELLAGSEAPPEVVEQYRTRLGLDQPIPVQYAAYLGGLLQGDFGASFRDGRPALEVVMERVPKTLWLATVAYAGGALLGILLGMAAALAHGTLLDRGLMSVAVLGYSMPNFFLGVLLIYLFAMVLQVLPSSGSSSPWHILLPALTLGTAFAGQLARFTRSAMLEVLGRTYMRTAAAKGVQAPRRLWRHALPNALIPVVTIMGLKLGSILAWAVVTESVFAWPGVARLLTSAVAQRDLPVVQTIILLTVLVMVVVNVTVDILYGWLDPRIASERSRMASS
ncbi:ABC transporter permease [Geminicoccaceae bacterium 1502E]|nr:ABC transporter permease [Geminicoccaceae bacterium 1502E]